MSAAVSPLPSDSFGLNLLGAPDKGGRAHRPSGLDMWVLESRRIRDSYKRALEGIPEKRSGRALITIVLPGCLGFREAFVVVWFRAWHAFSTPSCLSQGVLEQRRYHRGLNS